MKMQRVFDLIVDERVRQDNKWGEDRKQPAFLWLTILIEEVGEVAKAILERDMENMKVEMIQCAAVIVAWMESVG